MIVLKVIVLKMLQKISRMLITDDFEKKNLESFETKHGQLHALSSS